MNEIPEQLVRIEQLEKELAEKNRELEIEAALEQVRARTMAMYKSEELQAVASCLFECLKTLDIHADSVNIAIFKEGSRDYHYWVASDAQKRVASFQMPYTEVSFTKDLIAARESGVDFSARYYSFEEKNNWFNYAFEHTDFKLLSAERKQFILNTNAALVSIAFGKYTGIQITNYSGGSLSDSEAEILKRFAKVFEQSYIRFLDLQKAEAQARESQIEAALERVRSRSTGMQKSEELSEVSHIINLQLQQLNFKINIAGFLLDYRDSNDFHICRSDFSGKLLEKTTIPWFDHPIFTRFVHAKESGHDFYTVSLTFDEKNNWVDHALPQLKDAPAEAKAFLYSAPGYASSCALLKNVGLFIENFDGIPFSKEENAILIRFGKVFEQSYIRFLDLQKAEEQALEAIKRASVDRVRAEIASMRTTKDLERITPLIWNELFTLGVPFFRCGVFIMDEEKQEVQSYLSTPEGKAIASFRQPYNTPGEISEMVVSWHKRELYKQHWNEEKFIEFTQSLVDQHAISSGEKYLTENRPSDLYLHFVPFMQGMLYVGSTAPLIEYELQLVQNLADAFSTAYARYEDFNKLEIAKEEVDKALIDLKHTQAKLVQSEKMASLGELTAGIAHEIQNPLNFVNNFSELNKELIAELNQEIEAGNFEEVKIIAQDLSGNEEKISHHGRRAEAIVKGMLQHSRTGISEMEATDINKLADEYFRLAYHGLRGKDNSFSALLTTEYDETIEKVNVVPQDFGRVFLNIFNNAFYEVFAKAKELSKTEGRDNIRVVSDVFQPQVSVSTKKTANQVEITVTDNGKGIPENIIGKIFQPFFTTKPTGQGTGLGLSLAYDIITKGHKGELKVKTVPGEGTAFIIIIPVQT